MGVRGRCVLFSVGQGRPFWPVQLVALACLVVLGAAMSPSVASAESLCTDSWVGPAEGRWLVAANWSTGVVPSSFDVACIGSGDTVTVDNTSQAAVVQGAGSLVVSNATLEILSVLEPSTLGSLTVTNKATLEGKSEIAVTSSFTGGGGSYAVGTGSIVIEPGATGDVTESVAQGFGLEEWTLQNKGTFVVGGNSGLGGGKMAKLLNSGTLIVNGEPSSGGHGIEWGEATLVNTGTIEKTEGSGISTIGFAIENEGSVISLSGALYFTHGGVSGTKSAGSWSSSGAGSKVVFGGGTAFSLGAVAPMSGQIEISGPHVTAATLEGSSATVKLNGTSFTTLELTGSSTSTLRGLEMLNTEEKISGPELTGSGRLDLTTSFTANYNAYMIGKGSLVLEEGATGVITNGKAISLELEKEWTLENNGTLTITRTGGLDGQEKSRLINTGTLVVNGETSVEDHGLIAQLYPIEARSELFNYGTIKKTEGGFFSEIEWATTDYGPIIAETGKLAFTLPVTGAPELSWGEEENSSTPNRELAACSEAESVGCASGNFSQKQTDLTVGGRGVGLDWTRTYNSQAAADGVHGALGYGWSSSFSDHIVSEPSQHRATMVQSNGSSVPFTEGIGGAFTAPEWTQDTLSGSSGTEFTLTLEDQTVYKFAGASGRLESVTDRNGNETKLGYSGEGRLETITDPDGRKITLAYNGEGLVESATDPMKHVVKYTYEGGNLASVTEPGESSPRWQFKYDGSHQITEMIDGRGGKTVLEYDSSHRVISQTDPMARHLTFEYNPFQTTTTNHATGSVTQESFTSAGQPCAITHGYGTASATTELMTYNAAGELLAKTDGDGHTTKYGYDTHGNRTSMKDPEGHETKWTYDSTHDVETETKANGEKTTYKRDAHGNVLVEERPASGETIQSTTYKYDEHGNRESMTNPVGKIWKYEYDGAGDRTAEIDPEGDKRTWGYDEDSRETSMVSPRGHASGAEEAKFKTSTERDAQGRPLKITDPLGHTTKYTYDGDGNVETLTDGESNKTTYTYNADNELTKVKEPNGTVTETGYDGAGQVTSQTDGNKHTTTYVRNVLERVTEETDPLTHKTTKEYDAAGNLIVLTDAAKRKATYKYNADNEVVEVGYSDGKTPTVKYEYNADGRRTKMVDGTGTSIYSYDKLDRLTETENGNKEVVKYEYDLANNVIKITYPNGKAVTRAFDKDGRLEKVTDWLSHATTFVYDQDSDLNTTKYPSETKNEDKYTYDNADHMTETKMLKGTETLASLVYVRNNDSEVKKTTAKHLPGTEAIESTHDANSRLAKYGSTEYKYDSANNPTTEGATTNTYNEADELEKGTGVTYAYNELGQRTKTTPEKGPATTYTYDQAGNLIAVERPKEGATPKIEDSYAYDGDGLRASQTISGTTTHLAWDTAEELPMILADTTNSYIYGPGGLPIEQVNSEGHVTYLHHDQQGSTRLITGSTGSVEGKCSYNAYGAPTCEGTATTPLGYDNQYTNSDTGLIYLRARSYDPATAQFISVDPALEATHAPYTYALDSPLGVGDPTGLISWGPKVREAQAKCRGWRAWHSKKSQFYRNKGIYEACQNLLHIPTEVFGTGPHHGPEWESEVRKEKEEECTEVAGIVGGGFGAQLNTLGGVLLGGIAGIAFEAGCKLGAR
jgi:RHS repeat-associated protein